MRNLSFWRQAFLSVCMLHAASAVWAARPMVTDDANVVDPRACQNESWIRFGQSTTERWTVPGCNFFGDTEISVGANFLTEKNAANQQLGLVQVKKRWKVVEPGEWGLSTTVGRVQSPGIVSGQSSSVDSYVNVPVTWPTSQGPILHLNIGAYHHHAQRVTQTTWGLGAEVPLNSSLFAIVESFGETNTPSKVQMGFRYWVVPQHVQIDTTLGQDIQGASQSRWLSIGLRLLTPALY